MALSAILLTGCIVPDPGPDDLLKHDVVPAATVSAVYDYGPLPAHKLNVYRPTGWKASDKRSVLIYVHGGGWAGANRADLLDVATAQVGRGWVMVSIDYRLAPENPYPAAVYDVDRAIRWVRKNAATLGVSPLKVVTIGHSAGSNLVLLQGIAPANTYADPTLSSTLKSISSRPQAVVDTAGPTDLATLDFWQNGVHASVSTLNNWLGCPKSAPDPNASMNCTAEQLRVASPISYVSSDDPPLYLAHGDQDTIVKVSDATRLHDNYVAAGRDRSVWLDVVDTGPAEVRWHFPDYGLNYTRLKEFLDKVKQGELT